MLVRSDGAAVAFGLNDHGQTDVPELPAGLYYTAAAAGNSHTILLRSDGAAVSFGDPDINWLGIPVLPAGMRFTAAAPGYDFTVLLRSDGEVEAFGDNDHEQVEVPELPAGLVTESVRACKFISVSRYPVCNSSFTFLAGQIWLDKVGCTSVFQSVSDTF